MTRLKQYLRHTAQDPISQADYMSAHDCPRAAAFWKFLDCATRERRRMSEFGVQRWGGADMFRELIVLARMHREPVLPC